MLTLNSRVPLVAASLTLTSGNAAGREIHVAVSGDDAEVGTELRPFRAIGRGAAEAQTGAQVIVDGGTYGEWVKPPRGGASERRGLGSDGVGGVGVGPRQLVLTALFDAFPCGLGNA